MIQRHIRLFDVPTHWQLRRLLLISILLVLTGCSRVALSAPPSPIGSVSAEPTLSSNVMQGDLRQHALQLPALEPGTECPRASGRQIAPAYGDAVGDGPVYAAGLGTDGILYFNDPPLAGSQFYGSAWSGNKVLWIIAPTYRGPVLIRGGRLDGPETVRFNNGLNPPSELWIDAAAGSSAEDWRNDASFTRVQAPGCYAYQVDGQGFREIIVFEAQVQP